MLSSQQYHGDSFPGWGSLLAFLDYNIRTQNPWYAWGQFRPCNTTSLVSPVNRTFSWIFSELLPFRTIVINILLVSTLSFLFSICTFCHIFYNGHHQELHLPDFCIPNYVIQALSSAIYYRYLPVKYGNVPNLVYFNFSLQGSHLALLWPSWKAIA